MGYLIRYVAMDGHNVHLTFLETVYRGFIFRFGHDSCLNREVKRQNGETVLRL